MRVQQILLSLNGRINRLNFWAVMVPWFIVFVPLNVAANELVAYDDRTGNAPLWALLALPIALLLMIWVYFAILVKRLHDRDKSAKWLLMSLVPILGWIWVIVELGCLRGTDGANRFGSGGSSKGERSPGPGEFAE